VNPSRENDRVNRKKVISRTAKLVSRKKWNWKAIPERMRVKMMKRLRNSAWDRNHDIRYEDSFIFVKKRMSRIQGTKKKKESSPLCRTRRKITFIPIIFIPCLRRFSFSKTRFDRRTMKKNEEPQYLQLSSAYVPKTGDLKTQTKIALRRVGSRRSSRQ
jgi:hypothetical protein